MAEEFSGKAEESLISDMDKLKKYLNEMDLHDIPEQELTELLKPELKRFVMHIIDNTHPSIVGAQLQRSVLRKNITDDIPSSQLPLKAHLNSVADVRRYQNCQMFRDFGRSSSKPGRIDFLKNSLKEKCSKINKAKNEMHLNFEKTEYCVKRMHLARTLISLFNCFIDQMESFKNKYESISKVPTEEGFSKSMDLVRVKVSKLESINKDLNILNKDLRETSNDWRRSKINFEQHLLEVQEAGLGGNEDPELIELLSERNKLKRLMQEKESQCENGVAASHSVTDDPFPILSSKILEMNQSLTNLADGDEFIKLFDKINEMLKEVEGLESQLTKKLTPISELLMKQEKPNLEACQIDIDTSDPMEDVLNSFLNTGVENPSLLPQCSNQINPGVSPIREALDNSWQDSSSFQESFDDTLNSTFNENITSPDVKELTKLVEDATNVLLKMKNNLNNINEEKVDFLVKCFLQIHSKIIRGHPLAYWMNLSLKRGE